MHAGTGTVLVNRSHCQRVAVVAQRYGHTPRIALFRDPGLDIRLPAPGAAGAGKDVGGAGSVTHRVDRAVDRARRAAFVVDADRQRVAVGVERDRLAELVAARGHRRCLRLQVGLLGPGAAGAREDIDGAGRTG